MTDKKPEPVVIGLKPLRLNAIKPTLTERPAQKKDVPTVEVTKRTAMLISCPCGTVLELSTNGMHSKHHCAGCGRLYTVDFLVSFTGPKTED